MVPLSGWNPRNSSIFWSSASSSTDPIYLDTWSIAFGDLLLMKFSLAENKNRFMTKKSPGEICIIAVIEQSGEESLELMEATELLKQISDTTYHKNQLDLD